jgi:hypothetical protein
LSDQPACFNEVFLASVDKTITELLSSRVCAAFYDYLEKRHGITRDQVPCQADSLTTILSEVFGGKPARTIERRIARYLCAEFDIPFLDTPDFTLQMYIQRVKNRNYENHSQTLVAPTPQQP